ncbi:MAG: ABC transporter permease [Spartobacteria bacterium]|nr:ABC transporter permease [Spartobacteria bacterium]
MWVYLLKRILHMIPILFGVILLTFILFNVVGGSPASMVLEKHADAKALEDFDEQRGYNKPLLLGWWTPTRAFEDVVFTKGAALWDAQPNAMWSDTGYMTLERGAYPLSLAFSLYPNTRYRWRIIYRTATDQSAWLVIRANGVEQQRVPVPRALEWETLSVDIAAGESPAALTYNLQVSKGALDVRALRLQRRVAGFWDSQFVFYLRQLLTLDFGVSLETNQKVSTMLLQGVGPSLMLTIPIFTGGLLVSITLALLCAYYRGRVLDRALVVVATALMSINYIIWVVAGQFVLAYKCNWFPIWGFESWGYVLLPVIIGIVTGLGQDVRFYRTVMLDEMYKDYARTAQAKGLCARKVLFRHVLRNAMIPILTNISMSIPFLFMGSILLESYFGIPGLGNLSINAINSSDLDVVRAVVFIGAVLYLVANLVTDICYAWADPRVRLG